MKHISDLHYKSRKLNGNYVYDKAIILTGIELQCKGTLIQKIKIPVNTTIEKHYHKYVRELFYIVEGKGNIIINDNKIKAKKDVMIFVEPKDWHSIETKNKSLTILIFKTNVVEGDIHYDNKYKRISIDYDDTLVEGMKSTKGKALKGAVEFTNKLKKDGWEIIISTCRPDWQVVEIRENLEKQGFKFDMILPYTKPKAKYYIDDRAIKFNGNFDKIYKELK